MERWTRNRRALRHVKIFVRIKRMISSNTCINGFNYVGIEDRKIGGREMPPSRTGSTKWSVWRILLINMLQFV